MTRKTSNEASKARLDAKLDEALEETFPASDPVQETEPRQAEPPVGKKSARRPPAKKTRAK